jgi:hypothetical protein
VALTVPPAQSRRVMNEVYVVFVGSLRVKAEAFNCRNIILVDQRADAHTIAHMVRARWRRL